MYVFHPIINVTETEKVQFRLTLSKRPAAFFQVSLCWPLSTTCSYTEIHLFTE